MLLVGGAVRAGVANDSAAARRAEASITANVCDLMGVSQGVPVVDVGIGWS